MKKKKIPDAVVEGIMEIGLTFAFALVGILVWMGLDSVFSFDMPDFETLILIGFIFLVVVIGIINLVKWLLTKDKKK